MMLVSGMLLFGTEVSLQAPAALLHMSAADTPLGAVASAAEVARGWHRCTRRGEHMLLECATSGAASVIRRVTISVGGTNFTQLVCMYTHLPFVDMTQLAYTSALLQRLTRAEAGQQIRSAESSPIRFISYSSCSRCFRGLQTLRGSPTGSYLGTWGGVAPRNLQIGM